MPVATLDPLQQLSEAINSDANLFNHSMAAMGLKSDLTYVNTQLDAILKKSFTYANIDSSNIKLNLKSNITYVDTACQAILNRFEYYEATLGIVMKLFDKSYKLAAYTNTDINVALSTCQAGIDRRVCINSVDMNNKFKHMVYQMLF